MKSSGKQRQRISTITKRIEEHPRISSSKDGELAIVEQNYAVRWRNARAQLYRINLFHTTSRVDANGKQLSEFINTDLPIILEKVLTSGDLRQVNGKIKEMCYNYLASMTPLNQESQKQLPTHTKPVLTKNNLIELPMIEGPQQSRTVVGTCGKVGD